MTALRRLGEGVFHLEGEVSLGFGVTLPNRTTALRLDDGSVVLWSPMSLSDDAAEALAAIGPVRFLVGPSAWHHMFLAAAKGRYEGAALVGTAGLVDKRADLAFEHVLTTDAAPWGGELAVLPLGGAPKTSEVAAFHRASRTLVLADLLFHVDAGGPLLRRMMLAMAGTGGGALSLSRLWRAGVADSHALADSIETILAWGFDRVVMSHGRVIDRDAKDRVAAALAPLRRAPA